MQKAILVEKEVFLNPSALLFGCRELWSAYLPDEKKTDLRTIHYTFNDSLLHVSCVPGTILAFGTAERRESSREI